MRILTIGGNREGIIVALDLIHIVSQRIGWPGAKLSIPRRNQTVRIKSVLLSFLKPQKSRHIVIYNLRINKPHNNQ